MSFDSLCVRNWNEDEVTTGGTFMRSKEGFAIRQLALTALRESIKMFRVACTVIRQGNKKEGIRLWREARKQRTNSYRIVAEADRLERDLRGGYWLGETVRST